jgi:putative acetyltransferase
MEAFSIVGPCALPLTVREATDDDLDAVLDVERRAFGQDTEANLVRDLLVDATAAPLLSLLAVKDGKPVGHVLFTSVAVIGAERPVYASILAPLAVVPEAQGRGCGSRLVEDGLDRLARSGVALVFVLGDPNYYDRFGFAPAWRRGLEAPYELPPAYAEAWMVKTIGGPDIASISGTVRCAEALSRPELWRE